MWWFKYCVLYECCVFLCELIESTAGAYKTRCICMPHFSGQPVFKHWTFSCSHSRNQNVIGDGDNDPDGENVLFWKNIFGSIELVRCMFRIVYNVHKTLDDYPYIELLYHRN